MNDFPRPDGIVEADVDAWSGGAPTQFTTQTYHEVFISGTVPGPDTTKVGLQVVPDANGNNVLWVDGCAGTPVTSGFLNLDNVEADHPDWHAANADWIARAKQGPGTPGGPDPTTPTKTSFIFDPRNTPYGKSWGAPFAPTTTCQQAPASPSPSASVEVSPSLPATLVPTPSTLITPPPITPPPTATPTAPPPPTPTPTPKPTPTASPPPTETPTAPPPPTPAPT